MYEFNIVANDLNDKGCITRFTFGKGAKAGHG